LPEKSIKNFYNGLTKVFDFVSKIIDSFGGLTPILLAVANTLSKMY